MVAGRAMPGAGRPKGSINKSTLKIQELLKQQNYDPIVGLINVARDTVRCRHCENGKVTPFDYMRITGDFEPLELRKAAKKQKSLPCPSCAGTTFVPVEMKIRAKAMETLSSYVAPRLAAVKMEVDDVRRPIVRRHHAIDDPEKRAVIEHKMLEIEKEIEDEVGSDDLDDISDEIEQ